MKRLLKTAVILLIVMTFYPLSSIAGGHSTGAIYVYGPGGPFSPMHEAARVFSKQNHIKVVVVKGPAKRWMKAARKKADIIYSGSEFMMQNFVWAMRGKIDPKTIKSLYLRPSGILVRKGNPKNIKDFSDLLKPGIKILVVDGAGQTGLWEDMAGREGNINTVRAFRKNIVFHAKNSAQAKRKWLKDSSIDAWLIWNIWQISNKKIADFVPVSKQYMIYRDCGIALTHKGNKRSIARKFYDFILSKKASGIFKKWGWITN